MTIGGTTDEQRDPELDAAFERLSGTDLYLRNAFRVTGLPTSASPREIARRREEAALAVRLGTALPAPCAELPPPTPPDQDAVKAAFDALRGPTERLVHELLWLAGTDDDHDRAIRAHCAAVEAEHSTDVDRAGLTALWAEALTRWAACLADEALWERARARVGEIDDPRLTTGTVRRIRHRLPGHIAAVSAGLAARAATAGKHDADRHVRLLNESPLDAAAVRGALRAAAAPAEERVHTGCAALLDEVQRAPWSGESAIDAALARLTRDLWIVEVLLGTDDAVTAALSDGIARSVNQSVVMWYKEEGEGAPVVRVLTEVRRYAVQAITREQIETNLDLARSAAILSLLQPKLDAGLVNDVRLCLVAWRRVAGDVNRLDAINRLLADYGFLGRLTRMPRTVNLLGFGFWFGSPRQPGPDRQCVVTHFIVLLGVPVVPLTSYAVGPKVLLGTVPLTPVALWARRIMPVVLLWAVVAVLFGVAPATWVAGVVGAVVLGAVGVAAQGRREFVTEAERVAKW